MGGSRPCEEESERPGLKVGLAPPRDGPDKGSPSDWSVLVVLTVHNLEYLDLFTFLSHWPVDLPWGLF